MAIQDRVTDEWMRQPEVLGTAVGLDSDGLPALVVFIDRKAARAAEVVDSLPKSLDSIKVLAELTGKFRALGGDAVLGGHTVIQTPPIQLGTSGGWRFDQDNGVCCGGTLGALVAIGSTQYILSNYHVFELNGAPAGAPIIQPGLLDVSCNANNAQTVATLIPRDSLPNNNVDCAIAQINPGMVRTDGSILEVGTISSQTLAAALGQNVKKSGRTTGLTQSSITKLHATIKVPYTNCDGTITFFQRTFTGQIIIANNGAGFLCGGDSGSLLLENVPTNPRAIGLLFAGDDENCQTASSAVANPIGEVLSFLGATMVGQGGGTTPSNDQCSGATALSDGAARMDSTVSATSTGDPTPICRSNFGKGVWYAFTPPTSGTVTVSTCGSNFDTVLQVYTGGCTELTAVPGGCDDDKGPDCPGPGHPASVSFAGTAGTTYRILAGGFNSLSGNLQIVARVSSTPTPTRIISLSGNLAFGNVAVGSSAQRPLAISNIGNSALTVSSISYPTGFSGNFSGAIPAGSSQNVTVTFSPAAATTYGGTVTVNADQTSGTNTITASGTGTTTIPTPTPNPLCPPTITQSSSQAIMTGNSVACTNSAGHTDNSYWRAFNMGSIAGGAQYNVSSISFGVELANQTQPVTVQLYTNSGGAFPGGTRTQIASTTLNVGPSDTGTVKQVPLVATVPAGTSELVMELFTPNGEASGNRFFVGSNSSLETGPSYLSAPGCGFTTPTTTAVVGFPDMHIVFNINGSCGGITPTPTPPPQGSLVVTNVNSLSAAVAYANANPSIPNKTISFNLSGGGPWTLMVNSPLTITTSVKIDGASQPGYNGAANRVYVEGAGGVANIFDVRNHGGTTIKGLGIYSYDNTGVMIDNATGIWIEDCYIGFKQSSGGILQNRARSFNSTGVEIRGSNNQIHRSTISGVFDGINVGEPNNQVTGFVSSDNLFEGNNIGTDPTGQTTVGYENTSNGISLRAGAKSSWIGGWTFPEPSGFNVIAGNGGSGILIGHPTADHNRIFSNYLGLNRGGTAVITGSTNQQGVLIENGAQYNAAWSNFISGNRSAGIIVASSNNWILGNIIGLRQDQTQGLGGQPYGIILRIDTLQTPGVPPQGNPIGGSDPLTGFSFGNVICNQSLNGIEIQNGVSNGVMCNWIGFNTSGQPFPNGGWGTYLLNSTGNSDYGCRNAWGPNGLGRVGGSGGCCNSIQ